MTINVNGTRSPTFFLSALDSNSKSVTQAAVFVDGNIAVSSKIVSCHLCMYS